MTDQDDKLAADVTRLKATLKQDDSRVAGYAESFWQRHKVSVCVYGACAGVAVACAIWLYAR